MYLLPVADGVRIAFLDPVDFLEHQMFTKIRSFIFDTDGMETTSCRYSAQKVKEMIRHQIVSV